MLTLKHLPIFLSQIIYLLSLILIYIYLDYYFYFILFYFFFFFLLSTYLLFNILIERESSFVLLYFELDIII